MEKGYNSDISINGDLFHIQTEDWGVESHVLVTRIFKNGAVIKSYKTSYEEILKSAPLTHRRQRVREALRIQHSKILDLLQSGQMFYKMSRIEV